MQKNRGFTLVELMVTIAVLAIIVTMAAPSFNRLVLSQKLNSNTRALVGAFNLAKSQAAILKQSVIACAAKITTDEKEAKKICALATIPEYATLSDDQKKQDLLDNRVVFVALDRKVDMQSRTTINVVFNALGSTGTEQIINLCAGKELRTITVLPLGNVTQSKGSC